MTGRYSILASTLHSFLPRNLPPSLGAVQASQGILSGAGRRSPAVTAHHHYHHYHHQQQQQHSRSPYPPNSQTSRRLVRFPCSVFLRGGKIEAPPQAVCSFEQDLERSRAVNQFPSVRDTDTSVFLMRRAVSGGTTAEAEEMRGTSATPSGSNDLLVGGRYCVLLTGYASDYTQKLYGGYDRMFVKLLGDPQEKWDVYAVVDGQFPPEEELAKYDGFVVTGSRHDAHGSEEWITKLCALLRSLHEKQLNTLGVCFGHQVLSRALGGKTGKADVGWEIGLRQIQTTSSLASKPYAAGAPPVFRVLTVHQDQVSEIPPGGEVLGFSERTGIEMFAVGDHALGIQGHPEFTDDVVTDLIDTRLSSGILTEEEANDARATLKAGQADREALLQLCKGFLKRRRS